MQILRFLTGSCDGSSWRVGLRKREVQEHRFHSVQPRPVTQTGPAKELVSKSNAIRRLLPMAVEFLLHGDLRHGGLNQSVKRALRSWNRCFVTDTLAQKPAPGAPTPRFAFQPSGLRESLAPTPLGDSIEKTPWREGPSRHQTPEEFWHGNFQWYLYRSHCQGCPTPTGALQFRL